MTIGLGLLFAVIVGIIVLSGKSSGGKPSSKPTSSASAKLKAAGLPSTLPVFPALSPAEDGGDPAELSGFDLLPGGRPVPDIPANAPKTVAFGVILFAYQGSQMATKDAPTREKALERARAVLAEARQNFAEAVKKGDRGSTADAGRIPRGVLERAAEYVLFTLEKGAIYAEPIDTPRGYWVIKRLD